MIKIEELKKIMDYTGGSRGEEIALETFKKKWNMQLELINFEYITIDNKSSEWIKIEKPAKAWLFVSYDRRGIIKAQWKRILDNNNNVTWRWSSIKGSWITDNDNEKILEFEFKKLRSKKLKRILK